MRLNINRTDEVLVALPGIIELEKGGAKKKKSKKYEMRYLYIFPHTVVLVYTRAHLSGRSHHELLLSSTRSETRDDSSPSFP